MNRRFFRKWARWLLPLLVARAFLPVGFMLAADSDGLQLAFCPDQAPIVQSIDHAASGHAGHGGATADQKHAGAHLDSPCAFAVAALAANIDVPYLEPLTSQAAEPVLPERVVAVPLAGPHRVERIRGPPSLS